MVGVLVSANYKYTDVQLASGAIAEEFVAFVEADLKA